MTSFHIVYIAFPCHLIINCFIDCVPLNAQVICTFVASKLITVIPLTYFPLYFLETLQMNKVHTGPLIQLLAVPHRKVQSLSHADQHCNWSSSAVHNWLHSNAFSEANQQVCWNKGTFCIDA